MNHIFTSTVETVKLTVQQYLATLGYKVIDRGATIFHIPIGDNTMVFIFLNYESTVHLQLSGNGNITKINYNDTDFMQKILNKIGSYNTQ